MKKLIPFLFLAIITSACSNKENTNAQKETAGEHKEDKVDAAKETVTSVIEKDKNIFASYSNGTEKQLTFNKTDSEPILIQDENLVVFVREETTPVSSRKKLMKINLKDLSESLLTDKKPYKDALEDTDEIIEITSPTLSNDKKYILFVTEKYATGGQLVKVNVNSGVWTELFTAEAFEEISKAPYEGHFFAAQSDIGENGRDIFYRLVDAKGNIVKKFSDEESMNAFKAGLK